MPLTPEKRSTIERMFTYHPPMGDQPQRYNALRTATKELALLIGDLAPDSHEQDTALDLLNLAVMSANAAIARHETQVAKGPLFSIKPGLVTKQDLIRSINATSKWHHIILSEEEATVQYHPESDGRDAITAEELARIGAGIRAIVPEASFVPFGPNPNGKGVQGFIHTQRPLTTEEIAAINALFTKEVQTPVESPLLELFQQCMYAGHVDASGTDGHDMATAVTAFMGWLTSREEVAGPFSARHEAGQAARLVQMFCDAQGWQINNARYSEQIRAIKQRYPDEIQSPHEDLVRMGDIVLFVDETPGDYGYHEIKPALVQLVYATGAAGRTGHVHLHVFEAFPQDDGAVNAYYSANKEPGTWHWREGSEAE